MATGRLVTWFLVPLSLAAGLLAPALAAVIILATAPAAADKPLPLPRFVSVRAERAHVRTGPGMRYPVDWVYVHPHVPLEITAEFDHWRKVRDWEGTEGWIHRNLLSGRRTVMVLGEVRNLRRDPDAAAEIVARIQPGAVGELLACKPDWCRIEARGHKGWILRKAVWGIHPHENFE